MKSVKIPEPLHKRVKEITEKMKQKDPKFRLYDITEKGIEKECKRLERLIG